MRGGPELGQQGAAYGRLARGPEGEGAGVAGHGAKGVSPEGQGDVNIAAPDRVQQGGPFDVSDAGQRNVAERADIGRVALW